MATGHSNKRHKTDTVELQASHPGDVINAILNVDRGAFKEFARNMDRATFKSLLNRLSELGQDMEDTLTKFADIPPIAIASNVFPYLGNRTDWNNFSLVNKDINNAVTKHKGLVPPWPEGVLVRDESIPGEDNELMASVFSPDGDFIAHGDGDGNLYLWSRTKGLIANWLGDEDEDEDHVVDWKEIYFSPACNLLVTIGNYSNIKIWDLANDYFCLRDWTQDVYSVAFSPDGQVIASAGVGELQLRNVSDGTTSRFIRHALEAVHSVVFSPDGGTLALGGLSTLGRCVELWKLDGSEDSSYSLEGHSRFVCDLVFSPDGTILASASGDKTIRLWDAANRQCIRTLRGHTHSVYAISFTSDGNFLASGSHDLTIRVWSIASGNCIESIQAARPIFYVEFSRESGMLLTCDNTEIRLRAMDAVTLGELKQERDDLMKLNTEKLQQALVENDIDVDSESTKVALVDRLVMNVDRNRRKEIL
jgi:WD40 repeat protein